MRSFQRRSVLPASAEEVYRWHARRGAFLRLLPPWQRVTVVERDGSLHPGSRTVLRIWTGPVPISFEVEHTGHREGREFTDEQRRGPFGRWVHRHRFIPEDDRRSVLEDHIEYALPLDALTGAFARRVVDSILWRTFAFRHERIRHDLERHRRRRDSEPLRVAVTGSSGLVGSHLSAFLRSGGHTVHPVVRRKPRPGSGEIGWMPREGRIDAGAFEEIDAVVHLAGENLAAVGWDEEKKGRILRSREEGTRLLARALAGLDHPPRVLFSASATGYYGDRGDETVDEDAVPGDGFLSRVCRAWESAADPARDAGIRVVHGRFGLVLTASGGALATMLPPFRIGVGGPLGTGEQWTSWVAMDDLLGTILHALHDEGMEGAVNVVSPRAVRNEEFTRSLGRVLGRPTFLRVPARALRLVLGEMADETLLASARVRPAALEAAGFEFAYPRLEEALRLELGRLE